MIWGNDDEEWCMQMERDAGYTSFFVNTCMGASWAVSFPALKMPAYTVMSISFERCCNPESVFLFSLEITWMSQLLKEHQSHKPISSNYYNLGSPNQNIREHFQISCFAHQTDSPRVSSVGGIGLHTHSTFHGGSCPSRQPQWLPPVSSYHPPLKLREY